MTNINYRGYILDLKNWLRFLLGLIIENKGVSILLFTVLFSLFSENFLVTTLIGSVLYLMTLLRELLDHKIETDRLQSLDLDYFKSANDNLEDPLDGYVNLCFQEYLLLYHAYKDKQYIKEKEEALMRKEVLDIIASNLSPLMQRKFEQYYGKGRLPGILARKCFIKISLYVANNNKQIYEENDARTSNGKDIDKMFQNMMMNGPIPMEM